MYIQTYVYYFLEYVTFDSFSLNAENVGTSAVSLCTPENGAIQKLSIIIYYNSWALNEGNCPKARYIKSSSPAGPTVGQRRGFNLWSREATMLLLLFSSFLCFFFFSFPFFFGGGGGVRGGGAAGGTSSLMQTRHVGLDLFNAISGEVLAGTEIPGGRGRKWGSIPNTTLSPPERRSCVKVEVAVLGSRP